MAKAKTVFLCRECGGTSPKWEGRCPHCGTWNSLEESIDQPTKNRFAALGGTSPVRRLADVEAREHARQPTGIAEFDRVLGGGLVPGGVVLIGGDPGIGKSTLLLQTVVSLASQQRVLYVTGEESAEQVALRAQRLEVATQDVALLAEISLESILSVLQDQTPNVV